MSFFVLPNSTFLELTPGFHAVQLKLFRAVAISLFGPLADSAQNLDKHFPLRMEWLRDTEEGYVVH
jgi:hypothetical protein